MSIFAVRLLVAVMLMVGCVAAVCLAQQGSVPVLHVLTAVPTQFGLSLIGDQPTARAGARGAGPAAQPSLPKQGMWAGNPTKFFTGAFGAFLGHESGHLVANWALGTDPYLMGVHYGPIPFFTIQPGKPMNNHQHYITASAGFNAQSIINEVVLTSHPNLMRENEPTLKGLTAFNFWLSIGYAATAFAKAGPQERDTKGMADSLGINERWIGAIILVPTALDTYRYKHPDSKWAPIASRLSKLAIIFLAATAKGG